jgi:hypothetical protein
MKKTLIALCILFIGFNVQAQDDSGTGEAKAAKAMEMMHKKIDMDVNEELFMAVSPNIYISDNPKVMIMAMMLPETYEVSREKMEETISDKFIVTAKGVREMNGVMVSFMEGTSGTKTTLNNVIYYVKYDEESCIMFAGTIEQNADEKYMDAFLNARNSVIKKY